MTGTLSIDLPETVEDNKNINIVRAAEAEAKAKRQRIYNVLPLLSIGLAIAVDLGLERSYLHAETDAPYFSFLLAVTLAGYLLFQAAGRVSDRFLSLTEGAKDRALFLAGFVLLLNIVNLLTTKLAILPPLYFPAIDRVLEVVVEDWDYLLKCTAYSYRLLLLGWLFGATAGLITAVLIGFSNKANYWLQPFIKVLGPIPTSAWIPLVLVAFPSVVSGSVFLIALAVWFPTTVLTSSGIANIKNSYFEAASTLGAGRWYQIRHIGIPAAMPSVFQGLFNGTSASFITLVIAEMLGAKYGLGWYINWQKEMMAYANVYAGLMLIAVSFSLIISLLLKVRNRALAWQKGVIKW